MLQAVYKTKKELKESVGNRLKYIETSMFGPEYIRTGKFAVADSSAQRKWFAEVTMQDDLIAKVT